MNAIAIDGPSASGKSTVGFRIAQCLDFLYFDTGIMYRALTWVVLERGIDIGDRDAIGRAAGNITIDIRAPGKDEIDGRQVSVSIGNQDITWEIRSSRVDQNVSAVSAIKQVRKELSRQQRSIGLSYSSATATKPGVVMVGRDIGTFVLPEAPLKIFLAAPVEERAARRFRELVSRGKRPIFSHILEDMRRRDDIDSRRDFAPLRPAGDAHKIQTLGATVPQVVNRILDLAKTQFGQRPTPATPPPDS